MPGILTTPNIRIRFNSDRWRKLGRSFLDHNVAGLKTVCDARHAEIELPVTVGLLALAEGITAETFDTHFSISRGAEWVRLGRSARGGVHPSVSLYAPVCVIRKKAITVLTPLSCRDHSICIRR